MNAIAITPVKDAKNTGAKRIVESHQSDVLSGIYDSDINIAIWKRQLNHELSESVKACLDHPDFDRCEWALAPDDMFATLSKHWEDFPERMPLLQHMHELVNMFCCLFNLQKAGIRLTTLDRAMCPRFHVDKIPCRLITTYSGPATEWLPHQYVDRSKLGTGNGGLPDEVSGLFKQTGDIQQLSVGDVALIKGERWQDNEGAGLVHRSPIVPAQEKRLLLTLDFV